MRLPCRAKNKWSIMFSLVPPPNTLARFRALALDEASRIQDFMRLLMKPRNGQAWTAEDRIALRAHLRRAAQALPILGLFSLPMGSLLLAVLAFTLDRRHRNRRDLPHDTKEEERA